MDHACAKLGLGESARRLLRRPIRENRARLPITTDDDERRVYRAFRVQYNNARGPTKGGLRGHANETIDVVRALACWLASEKPNGRVVHFVSR